jgi:hypothetical protein
VKYVFRGNDIKFGHINKGGRLNYGNLNYIRRDKIIVIETVMCVRCHMSIICSTFAANRLVKNISLFLLLVVLHLPNTLIGKAPLLV